MEQYPRRKRGRRTIKITNGILTAEVTKGAYDNFYAKQGFEVVKDNSEQEENDNGEECDY